MPLSRAQNQLKHLTRPSGSYSCFSATRPSVRPSVLLSLHPSLRPFPPSMSESESVFSPFSALYSCCGAFINFKRSRHGKRGHMPKKCLPLLPHCSLKGSMTSVAGTGNSKRGWRKELFIYKSQNAVLNTPQRAANLRVRREGVASAGLIKIHLQDK